MENNQKTGQKHKCSTFNLLPIFHELNSTHLGLFNHSKFKGRGFGTCDFLVLEEDKLILMFNFSGTN